MTDRQRLAAELVERIGAAHRRAFYCPVRSCQRPAPTWSAFWLEVDAIAPRFDWRPACRFDTREVFEAPPGVCCWCGGPDAIHACGGGLWACFRCWAAPLLRIPSPPRK